MTLAKVRPATMNTTKVLAILLIALGIIAFAYQGISYKTQENVVDLGPIHVTAEKSHTLPLPPIAGVLALLGGIALLVVDSKKS
jgi:uncharacterized membrane protein YdcZ (DUF606 family)